MTTFAGSAGGFGIAGFSGQSVNDTGGRETQAGAHPDISTTIDFNTVPGGPEGVISDGNVKDVQVELPPGLVGNPNATPQCTAPEIRGKGALAPPLCPPETQVGVVDLSVGYGWQAPRYYDRAPVYNMEPPPGVPAQFAFNVAGVVVPINATVRPGGDYGVIANVSDISQTLPTVGSRLTLWGVPADPSHFGQRYDFRTQNRGIKSTAPRVPFITAPTACPASPFVTRMRAASWAAPNDVKHATFEADLDGQPIITENCAVLKFDPSLSLSTDSPAKRGAPTGITVKVGIPQNENPDGLATAHLKKAVVTLPEGMVVNPSSASGLGSCTLQDIGLNSAAEPRCSDSSKIGSVQVETPLLREPLTGAVYLAAQHDNPFDSTLAIYLAVKGPGVMIKLPGLIETDPHTGRVTTTFDSNPQLPFDLLTVRLKTGPRAPLSLPTTCGPATTTAVLTPWSGTAPVTVQSTFQVSADGNGAPCPAMGFNPKFTAGMANPAAGKDSSFTLGFSRTDEDQQLAGVSVDMPKGLLGRIAGVTQCASAAAEAGTCGEGSRIGSVTTSAGAGSNPFSLPGRAYLTGPYKGGPFGLSIVVPAVAGPFDLGTVVVRAAITVDPITAQLRVVSDPFPTILEGIPLQVRSVRVDVDRPGFMFNPTDCTATNIAASLVSTSNTVAPVSSRFQVGDCSSLALKPNLGLTLSGKGTDHRWWPSGSLGRRQPAGRPGEPQEGPRRPPAEPGIGSRQRPVRRPLLLHRGQQARSQVPGIERGRQGHRDLTGP